MLSFGDPFGYLFEVISGNARYKAVESYTVLKSYAKAFLDGYCSCYRPEMPIYLSYEVITIVADATIIAIDHGISSESGNTRQPFFDEQKMFRK